MGVVFEYDGSPPWYSRHSRYLSDTVEIANAFTEPGRARDDFLVAVRELSKQWEQRLMVLPTSDTNLVFLMENYEQFEPYIRIMGDRNFDAARWDLVHKYSCHEILRTKSTVKQPQTTYCGSIGEIDAAVEAMNFPVIFKPCTKDLGQTFYSSHNGLKAVKCETPDDMRHLLVQDIHKGYELLIQEYVPANNSPNHILFVLYADAKHDIRLASTVKRHAIIPFPFGTATLWEVGWQEDTLQTAQKVIKALEWRGFGMMELMKHQGEWLFIEFNGRPWISPGPFAQAALNFVDFLDRDMNGKLSTAPILATPTSIEGGNNLFYLNLGGAARGLASEQSLDLDGFLDWLESKQGDMYECYFNLLDPAPGTTAMRDLCAELDWDFGKLLHYMANRVAPGSSSQYLAMSELVKVQ